MFVRIGVAGPQLSSTVRRRHVRRNLLVVAILLVAGALLNVSVAWICAVTVNVHDQEPEGGAIDGHFILRQSRPGRAFLLWERRPFARDTKTVATLEALLDPCPSYLRREIRYGQVEKEAWYADAAGWPFYSLWSESRLTSGDSTPSVFGAIRAPMDPWKRHIPRVLPLRPIWTGFAVDTIVFAATLALLTIVPLLLRRTVRSKRGCCTKCGYPLCGAVRCPECGTVVSPQKGVA